MFHTVRLGDKNDYKLNDFYESLQKLLAYNVKSVAFCSEAVGVPEFDLQNAAKMALALVSLWSELNHSSIDHVTFCTLENAAYEIYKDLRSTVYFPMSKSHLIKYINSGIKFDNNKYNQKLPHIYAMTKWMANNYFLP